MPIEGIPNKQRHYEEMLALDEIERVFEKEIASFVILKSEYLYEEDTDEILKAFYFERGTKRFPACCCHGLFNTGTTERHPSAPNPTDL